MRLAHCFALENDFVSADCIEAIEFPDLAGKYRVYAVPKTIINDEASIEGALPEGLFLERVLEQIEPPADSDTPS